MGVAMQPPWGLAAPILLLLGVFVGRNVALRVESETEEFPLLMPRVHPHQAESYLCTPIRVDTDVTYSITGLFMVVRSREPRPLLGIAERWPLRSRAWARHSLVQRVPKSFMPGLWMQRALSCQKGLVSGWDGILL